MKPLISEDGSATAYSDAYRQTYHSTHGALTESRMVYLQNSGIADALAEGRAVHVLEVGFGLGLNFLLSAACALGHNSTLRYTALEKDLISAATLRDLDYGTLLPDAAPVVDALEKALQCPPGDSLHLQHGPVSLQILCGDALHATLPGAVDAVYQDAFSPDSNPELWTDDFLQGLCNTLRPGGRLTTYCVKGDVRRALKRCGLSVKKHPGPPGKREVLIATKL
ncbi:tRNA (5-methylaminomethyl-2-thiouridine)(34)-methyltransferase MnmD [Granulosicoccaceae sp. 1_MG-2023]|nr:tRNA (5-methylaminomethyl-2-thiouridine)(34)-methyltransferase MnmD [Granulosicoccaceae sp. 1_MG-2023]